MKFDFRENSTWLERPLIQPNILKNDSKSHSSKNLIIAQGFIPIILIAEASLTNLQFTHYLPIYRSARQKEYFLLI